MKHHLRILSEIHDRPWAITSRALDTIASAVERPVADLEALATRLGRPLDNTGQRVERRGAVAILPVEGPIFRYANLFTAISGATSLELLARDFQAALDHPAIEHIVLNVNSPGGQVDGLNEFADQVQAGTRVKPVTAYVDGLAASAAYWIAAASSRIISNEGSFQGSIGVVATVTDNRAAQERQGVKRYEIVSSQSPRKRVDLETDSGRAQIQEMVDAMADLFIGRVAAFRGVSVAKVLADFGQGGMLPAARAKAAGMVDGISSFEALLQSMGAEESMLFVPGYVRGEAWSNQAQTFTTGGSLPGGYIHIGSVQGERLALVPKENLMPEPTIPAVAPAAAAQPAGAPAPVLVPAVNAAAQERQRIAQILALPEAVGRETLARMLACETDQDVATAQKVLAAAPLPAAAPAVPANALDREMAKIPNPKIGAGAPEDDSPAAEAAKVLAFLPAHQKVQRAS